MSSVERRMKIFYMIMHCANIHGIAHHTVGIIMFFLIEHAMPPNLHTSTVLTPRVFLRPLSTGNVDVSFSAFPTCVVVFFSALSE